MAQNEDYSFKLLPECVAESDKFTDRAHQHASDTLDEMISEDKYGVNVLRSYFDTSEDFLTKKDFEILIPNLIHALGRVDESNYQNRLCTWLEARRFFRIAATFSTKVSGIDMFASTKLGLFRAQLTDKMQTVSDGEETSDDIQQLEHLQAKLNEVTEAVDRRDNT